MNFNTFRRGGLFDPITFDSGRALAKGTGEWFGGFGEPVMSASNPADLRMMADKALSSGDREGAIIYGSMADKIEQAAQAKVDHRKAQRAALNQMHRENEVSLAEQVGLEKKEKADREKVDRLADLAEKRLGKEQADIIRELDPRSAATALSSALKGEKLSPKYIDIVNENGDTEKWLTNEAGLPVTMVGVSKRGLSAKDAEKQSKDKEREINKTLAILSRSDAALGRIDAIKKQVEAGAAGPEYVAWKHIPWSDAGKMKSLITELEAELGFGRLTQMREESKTGGALGQVSNMELMLLKAAVSELEKSPAAGKEFFLGQLEKIETHYNNMKRAELGEMPDIDWDDESYTRHTVEVDGVRYFKDSGGNIHEIGPTGV